MRGTRRTRPFRAEIEDQRPEAGVNVFRCGAPAIRHHRPQLWLRVKCGLSAAKVRCTLTAAAFPKVQVEVDANICTTRTEK
jgi:hypothetical protein